MAASGWIKLHRKLLNSDMWKGLNSKQRDVAITILLMVFHDDGEVEIGDKIVKTKPGQRFCSLETIRENCAKDVSIQNIRTALTKLEKWGFLTCESTKSGRLITIVNWEVYQSGEENQQRKQQTTNKQLTTTKNNKEINNNNAVSESEEEEPKKKRRTYPEEFEAFWKAYPRTKKMNKRQTYSNFKALLEEGERPEDLIKAAEHYADECKREGTPERFIKHPTTFLGMDRPYVDYLEPDEPDEVEEMEPVGFEFSEEFLERKLMEAVANL